MNEDDPTEWFEMGEQLRIETRSADDPAPHLRFGSFLRHLQGNKCFYCAVSRTETDMFHIDHVIPLSFSGENSLFNLVVACRFCNTSKSNELPPTEFIHRLVKRNSDLFFREEELDITLSDEKVFSDPQLLESFVWEMVSKCQTSGCKTLRANWPRKDQE